MFMYNRLLRHSGKGTSSTDCAVCLDMRKTSVPGMVSAGWDCEGSQRGGTHALEQCVPFKDAKRTRGGRNDEENGAAGAHDLFVEMPTK